MDQFPRLLPIPGGTFLMGNDQGRPDERPAHSVELAPFRAAETPVTNRQYAAYVAATGAAPPPFWEEHRFAGLDAPVVGVNWFDANGYCRWLGSFTGTPFRLPTEAEREFAALGGLAGGDWPWAETPLEFIRWLESLDGPHQPQAACANGYGLFCMAENVHEWTLDWYDAGYYAISPATNPVGPGEGRRRASRGGSWRHREKITRINARSSIPPEFRYSDFGFRVYADA